MIFKVTKEGAHPKWKVGMVVQLNDKAYEQYKDFVELYEGNEPIEYTLLIPETIKIKYG